MSEKQKKTKKRRYIRHRAPQSLRLCVMSARVAELDTGSMNSKGPHPGAHSRPVALHRLRTVRHNVPDTVITVEKNV